MRCLLRFLSRGTAGAVETRERWFEGEVLTIGRASDQVLYVRDRRVALAHAGIAKRGSETVLTALTPAGVVLNGAVVREARLVGGDGVQVGENLLRILPPPADADLALSFELDPAVRAEDAGFRPTGLRLRDYGLGMRSWAWLALTLVLGLGLALPASGLLDAGWQRQLRATVLPADSAWNPGPMARVHAVTATNCENCHAKAFVRVRDEACLGCHQPSLHQHAGDFRQVATTLDRAQCTDCHREHDGSAALIRSDDATCAACHGRLKAVGGAAITAGDASDFYSAHPEFRVTNLHVLQQGARPVPGGFVIESRRLRRDDPSLTDGSGLLFPHDEHVAEAGIRAPEGTRVLACGDCHQADAEGGFRPIAMTRDCADCHRLDFDPADPDRTLPHGQPQAVADMLVEYYSARYLEGFANALPLPGNRLRPGPALSAADRALALERARARAANASRDVIERRVCVTCHVVDRTSGSGEPLAWVVKPVALTARWLPEARFDHRAHNTTLTPCSTCHQAGRSQDARDVLMPAIADCRTCHAGSEAPRGAANLVASGCMTCHGFHRDDAPLWEK
jgi:hypothetical protein